MTGNVFEKLLGTLKKIKVLEYMSFYMYIRTYVYYIKTIIWSLKRSIKNVNVSLMACETVTVNGKIRFNWD